jgi:hypothetical protein
MHDQKFLVFTSTILILGLLIIVSLIGWAEFQSKKFQIESVLQGSTLSKVNQSSSTTSINQSNQFSLDQVSSSVSSQSLQLITLQLPSNSNLYTDNDFMDLKIPISKGWQVTPSKISNNNNSYSKILTLNKGNISFNFNFLSSGPTGFGIPNCWQKSRVNIFPGSKFTIIQEQFNNNRDRANFYFLPTQSLGFQGEQVFEQNLEQFLSLNIDNGKQEQVRSDIIACEKNSSILITKAADSKKFYLSVNQVQNSETKPSSDDLREFNSILNQIEGLTLENLSL